MKRIKLMLLVSSFSLFMFACSNNVPVDNASEGVNTGEGLETIVTHGNYKAFEEEAPLFNDADLVVIAETDTHFLDREHVVKYFEPDSVQEGSPQAIEDFYTRTPITVLKVLKTPESVPVIENEKLDIIEPVSIIEQDGSSQKIALENYNEIKEGEEYVLYLKLNTYGEYGVINMNNGRFSLGSDTLTLDSLDHGHEGDQDKHNTIKRAVEERFKVEIEEVQNR
ncbi:hypothetical protein JCM10914A_23080 [Paenibacillus sp. JCM 10914]|uniref:hypothetical protein n=1 Tax=Paenibacillus sp. JCM 10914 TaxID=1236974 RepID=UPI0003CC4900|nr:hypothetical protein [Paenibacillus sp. JCM 10914]GAE05963.1 hypothetical protein JCM10914_2097 [Paenibacillus sp. JCM 10914]